MILSSTSVRVLKASITFAIQYCSYRRNTKRIGIVRGEMRSERGSKPTGNADCSVSFQVCFKLISLTQRNHNLTLPARFFMPIFRRFRPSLDGPAHLESGAYVLSRCLIFLFIPQLFCFVNRHRPLISGVSSAASFARVPNTSLED